MPTLRPMLESVADGQQRNARRRLLLVSYHFPPDPAVGGVRWERLARYFVGRGWAIDVIARDFTKLTGRDEARASNLPSGVTVYSASEDEPWLARAEHVGLRVVRHFRSKRGRSSNAVIVRPAVVEPPPRRLLVEAHAALVRIATQRSWAKAAARLGGSLAKQAEYDIVVSSGPPHMAHEAARSIAKTASLPFVIDFRDPWSAFEQTPGDNTSALWFAAARHYERRAVAAASLVVMNTDLSRDDMRARYPAFANRIITVPNGSDDDPLPVVARGHRFTIRFAGTIYLDRDPRPVFRAAANVVRNLHLTPKDFGLEFIGEADEFRGQSVRAIAAQEGVGEFVTISGPQPRDAAMRFLAGANMLLSLPQDANMCVPAKIFEYVRFDAWLLVLATERSATAAALRGTTADVVDPADVDRMTKVIEQRYRQHADGARPAAVGQDGRFDRARQAEILLERFETIAAAER
ncbi:MAG TPA: glycosyltransferase [Gemmatimonadaceae bacterium]